ncbi:urease accessory protein UreE [Telmatospirillum sp.]|uniref:urease accessory protein UreE n=1 Tax=Telmatospirillum sp. TaxID=2079197 RepID=UPI002840DD0F|nr:urease accessory protein UreE [Telmatospirillum sp.]MDR3439796.1 urease accessory protein UreE [Telmatospirillum sp.]
MRRVIACRPAGTWPIQESGGTITLAWADRHRRRLAMTDDAGDDFLLDLPEATLLGDGDGLELADGGWIAVRAAAEAVADIHCTDAEALVRVAWHIGNRHAPLQILAGGGLRILDDHVLVAMVTGLGGRVERRDAPFQAEGGAYASASHQPEHHHHA